MNRLQNVLGMDLIRAPHAVSSLGWFPGNSRPKGVKLRLRCPLHYLDSSLFRVNDLRV